jgi:hypothetical protein
MTSKIITKIIEGICEDFDPERARRMEYEDAVKSILIQDHKMHHGVDSGAKFKQCVATGFANKTDPYVLANAMMKMGFGVSGFD